MFNSTLAPDVQSWKSWPFNERRPIRKNYIELSTIDHRAFKYPGYVLYHASQFIRAYLIPRSTDFSRLRLMDCDHLLPQGDGAVTSNIRYQHAYRSNLS